ncbi:unnamed protein product, partial [Caenorhabditis auriculariae]
QTMSGQPMEHYAWHAAPPSTSVTGTSELFSSTFAMLSDTAVTYPEQWAENNKPAVASLPQPVFFDQPVIQQPTPNAYDQTRYDLQFSYRQQYGVPQTFSAVPTAGLRPAAAVPHAPASAPAAPATVRKRHDHATLRFLGGQSQPQQSQQQQQQNTQTSPQVRSQPGASMNSPAVTSSDSAASGTPPLSSDVISTDVEGTDEERVMCMACRGVYPSRRSLTGHIGRNEKCREIIGRNYLDQVAAGGNPTIPGTESAIKSGAITNGHDGMSPVCPFCDRFISHYKGNIRRHINQCCKNSDAQKRPRSDKEKSTKKRRKTDDSGISPDLKEGYDPCPPGSAPPSMSHSSLFTSPPISPTSSSPFYGHQRSAMCSPISGGSFYGSMPAKVTLKRESAPENGGSTADFAIEIDGRTFKDAYICDVCDFVTVYKGNMKRHLNTCHPVPECKSLKGVVEWDRKLEAMRASAMGINREELQLKLSSHKQNSTRGRKPRKKKDNQSSEESEPMTDYEPNSNNSTFEFSQSSFTE